MHAYLSISEDSTFRNRPVSSNPLRMPPIPAHKSIVLYGRRGRFRSSSSMVDMQKSISLSISCPQNLSTVHPCSCRRVVTSRSRCIFRSILGIQKSRLLFISFWAFAQSYPCQKSPSQKTAIFLAINAMSGFPKIVLLFLV